MESLIPRGNTTLDVEFSEQLQRTAEWLNSLPLARLDREREGGSIADRAFAICQEILGLPERKLPRLRAHGAGSQLAVVGQELSEVMASVELDRINSDLAFMRFISAFISLRRTGAQR